MGKIVWIVNYYCLPPNSTGNSRHLEFAHYLQKAGYEVLLFSASWWPGFETDLVPKVKKYETIDYGDCHFVHIRTRHYAGNGINRMYSIFNFAWCVFRIRKQFKKPDVILHNIHVPFDYPIYWTAKRLKTKYVAEAWDLWPDQMVRFGLISKNNPAVSIAYRLEKSLYMKADKVVFSMEGGIDYLRSRHWTKDSGGCIDQAKIHYINNGVNVNKFNTDREKCQLDEADLRDNGYFKIVYMGSVNMVNHIQTLIDAANFLKRDTKYRFFIYGDGRDRSYLEQYCKEKNITNVLFKEKHIPLEYVAFVVSQSDLNVMNYEKTFGLYGVSSGKLFQYLAAGKPIIANIKMNYCEIERKNLGIARDLDTPEEYANAIRSIANLPDDQYKAMCMRVGKVAAEFDFKVLSDKLIRIFEQL
jgi:glycosyltransferase involved in cell wall biosynthesis